MNECMSNPRGLLCLPPSPSSHSEAVHLESWEPWALEKRSWHSLQLSIHGGLLPIAPCSSLHVEHSLDPGATGVCKHWACWTLPLKPPASQNPRPQFLFSWGSFCKALQAPLLLLVSAGARREVPLSHWPPHPQEGHFSLWRGNFLSL